MNLVVLLSSNEINDNQILDSSFNANMIDLSFMTDYQITYKYLTFDNYVEIITKIDRNAIVINLCDGTDDDGQPGLCIVKLLDQLNLVYTGCSSRNYEWRKSTIKKFNVSTPKYILLPTGSIINQFMFKDLSYPLIMKPNHSGGSLGITTKSKVSNFEELNNRYQEMKQFGDIMIEEFIEGREFTVLTCENINNQLEPYVFEPLECIFANGETFKHYHLKWETWTNIKCENLNDNILQKKIIDFCRQLYIVMELDSYVRFDLRINHEGVLYVNDVNSYCGIFYPKEFYGSADLILKNSRIMNHKTFLEENIKCAQRRALTNVLKIN